MDEIYIIMTIKDGKYQYHLQAYKKRKDAQKAMLGLFEEYYKEMSIDPETLLDSAGTQWWKNGTFTTSGGVQCDDHCMTAWIFNIEVV